MDQRLLRHYKQELTFIREMGREFAQEFPKIAGRLSLQEPECPDPYVERLLEGFAFIAARIQLKLDARFPRFTEHLLDLVYPHYLAPTPSMAMLRFEPDPKPGVVSEAGVTVPRGSALNSRLGKGERTRCEFRTAHDLTLWPLALTDAEYLPTGGAVAALGIRDGGRVKAGIRLVFETFGETGFDQLALNHLPLFLAGGDEVAFKTYEQLLGNAIGLVASPGFKPGDWRQRIDSPFLRPLGFAREQALLPPGLQSFEGYRLLHEYFAFPQRFLLVGLDNLAAAVRRCTGGRLELVVLLDRADPALEHNLDASRFLPFCVPAINLFPKKADPVHLSDRSTEYQVVPDRTRPLDFEVYRLTSVVGYGSGASPARNFYPLYALDAYTRAESKAYYRVQRRPRLTARQMRYKQRMDRDYEPPSRYLGDEVYVSLVDNQDVPYPSDLRQLSVETLCTNRHLPLNLAIGAGDTDFTVQEGAPVLAVRCVAGPTEPRPPFPEGEVVWRLIGHLALNYLSLVERNGEQGEGAEALREMLALYAPLGDAVLEKQIQGLRQVASRPVIRRVPLPGPVVFGRGLEITLTCDENAFEGGGVFLFGAVLEEFFAKYVSINSFTETVIRTRERGEVMRWRPRLGRRRSL